MSQPRRAPAPSQMEPADFFVLRTPLLPFDAVEQWSAQLTAPHEPQSLSKALDADRTLLRTRLRAYVERPEVREALFVASPSLEEGLPLWLQAPDSEYGLKVERALVRYFLRMAGRCTPFGLFASCSVGHLGARTHLEVADARGCQRDTRLDMDYLTRLVGALVRHPALRDVLRYRPNGSLYRAAGRLRYVETRHVGAVRRHHLSSVRPDAYLNAVLEHAREGARPDQLVRTLVALDAEVDAQEAAEYVRSLVDNDLLVPELAVPVTGPEPLPYLVERLRVLAQDAGPAEAARVALEAATCLDDVGGQLARLDAEGPGRSKEAYLAIATRLEALPVKVELPRLFQVDLYRPAPGATLGPEVLAEVTRAVELVRRMGPPAGRSALSAFCEAFTRRYEGREVPLLEALDEESGVGFQVSNAPAADGAPLLRGLAFPASTEGGGTFGARELHLMRRLTASPGARVLTLGEEDLKALSSEKAAPAPDALSVGFSVMAASDEALARGDFSLVLRGAGGPSGANTLGRFCHGDEALREAVERHLRAEEALRPDAVFAEVVHLPEGRIGNVLLRPQLRGHEIPFLGASGAPGAGQIPVEDLRVSVVEGRVVLRSKRLGREVLPRLTTAHNFSRGLGVYRFLCMLQHEGRAVGLSWSWGALEGLDFLPRVTSGRVVLALARWRLGPDVLKPLGAARGEECFRAVQQLRERLGLPRHVALVNGDNVLPLDLDSVLCVETLASLVKDSGRAVLREQLVGPDALCAYGPEGRFVHELFLPMVRRQEPTASTLAPRSIPAAGAPRHFAPGSEWLYAKLYAGTAGADDVLCDAVAPLMERLVREGVVDRWFFIRFEDPDWHVRLRLHGDPARLHRDALPALSAAVAPLARDGVVWKVQLDTYERELERYGGPEGMTLAEELFHADSEAVLKLMALLDGDAGAEARWQLTLRGLDLLLDDLGLDPRAKLTVAERSRDYFGREFHMDTAFTHQLGARYRQARAGLEAAWTPDAEANPLLVEGLAVLHERSERLVPVRRRLEAASREGRLGVSLMALAGTLLHMHANRMLRSAARAQELVLYDFLARTYQSQLARARAKEQRS
ncbi:lantibiotic dehydratase [Corallococcus macrosporus]|uniref:Lantibiotic dehydratase n=1 Tax=Corallococcus macrosporus TaxID=35 RepID=A0ABS3DLC8_9BACT|nr:lantibiotic dehydratase [Corallococcus macrosporus]MBN8232156.1 lantibiotic dehydratase [Corallococcus macrosporus]